MTQIRICINGDDNIGIDNPDQWVKAFCIFNSSYRNYDSKPVSLSDPDWIETIVHLAYVIGGRTILKKELLTSYLRDKQTKIAQLILQLQAKELDYLSDEEWQQTKEKLKSLLALIKGPGIQDSFTTKMLHPLLRKLLPIVDNECIMNIYRNKRGVLSKISAIRKDMIASRTLIDVVEQSLDRCTIALSRVRIFDILLWARWQENKLLPAE